MLKGWVLKLLRNGRSPNRGKVEETKLEGTGGGTEAEPEVQGQTSGNEGAEHAGEVLEGHHQLAVQREESLLRGQEPNQVSSS